MDNLPPQYVIGPQYEQQSLPYECINIDYDFGAKTFVVPYPVSSDNQDPAQVMPQELRNTEFDVTGNMLLESLMDDKLGRDTGCVGTIGSSGSNEIPVAIPSLDSSMTAPVLFPAEVESRSLNEGVHPSNKPKPSRFRCLFCYKSYARPSRLDDHMMAAHMGVKRHVCSGQCGSEGCTTAFASKYALKRHCLPEEDRRVKCGDCGTTVLKQNIYRHRKMHQQGASTVSGASTS